MTNHRPRPPLRRSRGKNVVAPSRCLADGCRKTSSSSLENTQHDCAHKSENNIRGDYAQLADEGTCDHSVVSRLRRIRSYLLGCINIAGNTFVKKSASLSIASRLAPLRDTVHREQDRIPR